MDSSMGVYTQNDLCSCWSVYATPHDKYKAIIDTSISRHVDLIVSHSVFTYIRHCECINFSEYKLDVFKRKNIKNHQLNMNYFLLISLALFINF